MEERQFGKSDLKSSVIGFGGWPMGKGMYGPIEETKAIAAVHTAMDLGVTLFDTAANYGWGYGEELLGRAIEGRRARVVLVTKGGLRWNPELRKFDPDSNGEYLRECLEGSLKRLQTDYVDLYLIHWPDESRSLEEPMKAFAEFRKEGKIRYGGVSNFNAVQMDECLQHFPIITNQVGYNLFDRRVEKEVLPFIRGHGLGVMAYGSLAHGLLTGTMTPETKFSDDDWRSNGYAFGLPLFDGEYFLRNLRIVDRLKGFAQERGWTVAQMAVGWVLSNNAVTVALTGARNPLEIEENVKAANCKLTPEDNDEIERILKSEPPLPDIPISRIFTRQQFTEAHGRRGENA